MKQLTAFILLLVVINNAKAQTQIYNYLNHTSAWGVHSGGTDFSNNEYRSHYRYYMNGDTVIASNLYYKLFKAGVDSVYHLTTNTSSATFYDKYVGALREDSKCLYFIFSNDSVSIKLFDFNLVYNFPVPNMYANGNCTKPIIDVANVKQYQLGSITRYKYIFPLTLNWNLYEGIGSIGDILEQGTMCGIGFEYNSYLSCYTKDNNLVIIDSTFPCNLTLNLGGSNCTAKFCYNAVDSGGWIYTTLYNLSLANDSIVSTRWGLGPSISINNNPSFTHYSSYWDTTYPYSLFIQTQSGCQSSYSEKIKIGTNCTFLPLSFSSFNISNSNNKPHLFWQTNNEVNINHFIVKRSIDGNNFTDIAKVLATHKQKNQYEFTDLFANENNNINKYYYRLKYVESNGTNSFSDIRSIVLSAKSKLTVSPNPAKAGVIINTTNAKEILLLDNYGRVMKKQQVLNQSTKMNLQNIKAGMYFLQIIYKDNAVANEKLIVGD